MKSILGSAAAVAFVGWVVYVMVSPDACVRVTRVAAPVRTAFEGVRYLGQNWLSDNSRLTLLLWQIEADQSTQDVARQTFYGTSVHCGAQSPATPSPAITD